MSVRLYVEGGGSGKDLRSVCRRGFREFLERAGLRGSMPRIVACGGRNDAFDSFRTACGSHGAELVLLLVDAEGPVTDDDPWSHLQRRDGWTSPPGATAEQCHLMVQIMESWFLADRDTLAGLFGDEFQMNALPGTAQDVERVPKNDVLRGLEQATRHVPNGAYRKGRQSFEILGRLDPVRVVASSDWARRLLEALGAPVA